MRQSYEADCGFCTATELWSDCAKGRDATVIPMRYIDRKSGKFGG
jgi:hypothetical protein